MSSIPTKLEKCTGAMLASAIGDALGWPNEFRAKNTAKNAKAKDYFVEWTRRCGRPNWYSEKILPGEYSDDTQMILSVARSIIAGDWENVFISKELPYWLGYERGGGKALLKAADACKKGTVLWKSNYTHDYFNAGGNGAVMRILPHVITAVNNSDSNNLMVDVIKNSIVTHGHPRAILGATCYAFALNYLLRKNSVLEYGELVSAVLAGQSVWGAFPNQSVFGAWNEAATRTSGFDYTTEWDSTLTSMVKQLDFVKDSLKKGLMLDDNDVLTKLECFGKVNGAGDVAILAAIYLASRYANNPALGIKTPALSFGMDTDTIASITGGLLGMLCGTDWIPTEWKVVQDYECLVRMTELLFAENMREATKMVVSGVIEQYGNWQNTLIGKMRLVGTSTVPRGKTDIVIVYKWESVLGQTLYLKEYKNSNVEPPKTESQLQPQSDDLSKKASLSVQESVMPGDKKHNFLLTASDIKTLLGAPQLKRITFNKVMQILDILIASDVESTSIAKLMEVEPSIIDIIRTYIR